MKSFLAVGTVAARRAGALIMKNLGRLTSADISHKQAADFVTRVDKESEDLIVRTIRRVFPEHSFLAEESHNRMGGLQRPGAEFVWIIDPLDGTTNYIHGYPFFSVSIALSRASDIILGVVYDPLRRELFTARRGRGAFLNGRRLRVSTNPVRKGIAATGFPFRRREAIDDYLVLFKNIFGRVSDLRRAGSAALDLASVAAGRCEGFFELGLKPWDVAAGSLLVTEAGGLVTDFRGGSGYIETGNIVSGNPAMHAELLRQIMKVF